MTASNIKGFLVERDNRTLFVRSREEAQWAIDDQEYKVTPLAPADEVYAQVYDQFVTTDTPEVKDDTQERMDILEELYILEEEQIAELKTRLENALELVEVIYEFTSRDHTNLLEAKGTLKLVADSCLKWLKPKP